ncbi:hypothetical protein RhiJN_29015 [Ceratobasidium sp. AG-Ba]|nr:hypothetical protein RhiJN_29015 [Ceratobasidium sp. AG-Ba]
MSCWSQDSPFSNASTVCKQRGEFETWAFEVSADVVCRPRPSNGPLAELYDNSQRVPRWVIDPESQYHKLYSSLYGQSLDELAGTPSEVITVGEPTEESASQDLAHALPHIAHVVQRHISLSLFDHHRAIYSKADLCQPLDRLATHVWCTEVGTKQGYLFRTAYFDASALPGLICTANKVPRLELVHWIAEHEKTDDQLESVERRVYYGMVSSLWQRRALGYMDQFVFATAHIEQQLTVYAATWEEGSLKNPELEKWPRSRAGSDSGEGRGYSTRSSRSSVAQLEWDGSLPRLPFLDPQERRYKIVVYELGNYQTTKLYDMLHYYYLLRASRKLADEYRQKIFQDTLPKFEARVKRLGQHGWPETGNDNETAEDSSSA